MLNTFNEFFIKIQKIVLHEKPICDFMEDNLDENSMNVKFNNILSEINKLKEKINKESEKKSILMLVQIQNLILRIYLI